LWVIAEGEDRRRRGGKVARAHKKHYAIRFASVEHTDEELYRRLKCIQQSASPFFAVCLSEDRKNIICTSVRTGKVRFVEPADMLWN
jgi:hypothetical protein